MFGCLECAPLVWGLTRPDLTPPPPRRTLSLTMILFSRLRRNFGLLALALPFESLKAADHPLGHHVSREPNKK